MIDLRFNRNVTGERAEDIDEALSIAEGSANIKAWTVHAKKGTASPQEMQHLSAFASQHGLTLDEYLNCASI